MLCRHISRLASSSRHVRSLSSSPLVDVTSSGNVSYITLNNPAKRNALSLPMLTQLQQAVRSQVHSKCIVIRSTGPVFSSGHDLKELNSASTEQQTEIFTCCNELMLLIHSTRTPIMASVSGFATAAGAQLVAACHLAVCAEEARFATPGVNIGLFCSTPAVQLGRVVNRKVAMDMLLTGEPISSESALRAGLVSRVFSAEILQAETERLAQLIASKSKPVVELGIDNFESQMKLSLAAAASQSARVMVDNLGMRDGAEGLRAFVEKRHPVWEGDEK